MLDETANNNDGKITAEPHYIASNYGTPVNDLLGYNFNALDFILIDIYNTLLFGTESGAGVRIAGTATGTPDTNVSFGSGITSMVFKPVSIYAQNVAPVGQTNSVPLFVTCNNGTASAEKLKTKLTTPLATGYVLKCDDDNTPAGALSLSTSYQDLLQETITEGTCKLVRESGVYYIVCDVAAGDYDRVLIEINYVNSGN